MRWESKRMQRILDRGFTEDDVNEFLRARWKLWARRFDTLFKPF
jgi:hypothetical protein